MRNGEDRDLDTGTDPEAAWDEGSGEALEEMIEHADHAFGAESFGTTLAEQERGATLGARLAEERPDERVRDTDLGLIGEDATDTESQMVAESVPERDLFVAPEDSAMSVRDEAPGAVDHPDDYVGNDEPV